MSREEEWILREKWDGEKTEGFFADCARLAHGEPLAYIIGHVPFLSTTIFLDSHPLIPRVETEFWVEKCSALYEKNTPLRILDLCAGSGCIGVALLTLFPRSIVDFVEIDDTHHPTIEKNCRENDIALTRVHVYGGSLFEKVKNTYDLIVSNPPYIDPAAHTVDPLVSAHEPHRALFGGAQGAEFLCTIIREAGAFLNKRGILILEHEPAHVSLIHSTAKEKLFTCVTYNDQYDVPRYTHITRLNE